jgi:hypothetical protein
MGDSASRTTRTVTPGLKLKVPEGTTFYMIFANNPFMGLYLQTMIFSQGLNWTASSSYEIGDYLHKKTLRFLKTPQLKNVLLRFIGKQRAENRTRARAKIGELSTKP